VKPAAVRVASSPRSVHVFAVESGDRRLPRALGSSFHAGAARRAAHGERAERLSQLFRDGDVSVTATLRQLGGRAVHPDDCQLFSARQYRERRRWNALRLPPCEVPVPFDGRRLTAWTVVHSLTGDDERFVPAGIIYYNAAVAGGASCVADSTGSASAARRDEAIVRGFFEVVERDAVALWWYHRTRVGGIGLDLLGDAQLNAFARELGSLDMTLQLLDLTSDLEIPVVAAVGRPVNAGLRPARVFVGFGCHFDVVAAARRAGAEMAQALALGGWISDAAHLKADGDSNVRQQRVEPSAHLPTCVSVARRLGMDLLVADLTRPDVGVPVVKVLVPGMRPAVPRFAPGRLFDVPLRQGRRTPESRLNPEPFVL
jgi:thiazole/oxazole-forming peptide maturase SagD family component